jgi:hypothetical protein
MSLLFLRFIVHGGGSLIDPAGAFRFTCDIEKGFAKGGLSRSSMTDNCQISYGCNFIF